MLPYEYTTNLFEYFLQKYKIPNDKILPMSKIKVTCQLNNNIYTINNRELSQHNIMDYKGIHDTNLKIYKMRMLKFTNLTAITPEPFFNLSQIDSGRIFKSNDSDFSCSLLSAFSASAILETK